MKVKAVFGTLTWIVVLVVVAGFVKMQCSRSYRGLRGSVTDKVEHVKTLSIDEAVRKGIVDVSLIHTDGGNRVNIHLTRRAGHSGCHIRFNQGVHSLTSGSRTVRVRADSEVLLNLATSSSATTTLSVVR